MNFLKNIKRKEFKKEDEEDEALIEIVNEFSKNAHLDLDQILKDTEEDDKSNQTIIHSIDVLVDNKHVNREYLCRFKDEKDGYSLLHVAAKNLRHKLCNHLIDAINIDVNIKSKTLLTPLQVLVISNKFENLKEVNELNLEYEEKKRKFNETLSVLISKRADCNYQDEQGYTALHHAVLNNNYEAVLSLIEIESLDLNIEDKNNLTPLALACKNGFDQIAFLLIKSVKTENLFESNINGLPLHLACKNKEEKLELVTILLDRIKNEKKGHDILVYRYYPYQNIDKNLNPNLNEILNKLDSDNRSVLSILFEMNHMNIIKLLLKEYNIYVSNFQDENRNLLIHLAAQNGSPDLLKLLIKYNLFSLKLNKNNENGLHIAASYNKFYFIKEYLAQEKSYVNNLLFEGENLDETRKSFLKAYIPSIKCYNTDKKTPLFISVMKGFSKCVEVLATSDDLDLEFKDSIGNTVYHICAEINNFESLRYLLNRKDPKYHKALYIVNENLDTVLHVACKYGNLEIIRLVLSKVTEGFSSVEAYLSSRNKDSLTCFHLACIYGHYNIVEYFLKDLKMNFFLDFYDINLNNCMHLATLNGRYNIVSVLNDYDFDINVKNKDGRTPLEIAFKKGHFDIVKLLIPSTSSLVIQEQTMNEFHLHIVAYEGNHEIVELLLSKNVPIDVLDSENKNCLDVAIDRNNRDVIKVLLKDKNWSKLINLYSFEEKIVDGLNVREENPQLNRMFQKKMWDPILQILDNCKNGNKFDFSRLDPPLNNLQMHPLMLMARSGQETILKHHTVQKLLALKWRYLPRLTFYSNLFLYFMFILLYTLFVINLSNYLREDVIDREIKNKNDNGRNLSSLDETKEIVETSIQYNISLMIIIIIIINLLKNLIQIILIDRLSFFNSTGNVLEVLTYVFAFVSIISKNFDTKLVYSSVGILGSFLVFTLMIQKLGSFGLYVLAFRRTLKNSAKFFPIFLLIYIGFNLSFRLQIEFVSANLKLTEPGYLLKVLLMVLGGIENSELGLEKNTKINYLIIFLFIFIVCVILVNLFVGIAVGEINTVLDEADLQQISMRIVYVLKIQRSLKPFIKGPLTKRYFDLQFIDHTNDNEDNKFIKKIKNLLEFLKEKFSSADLNVQLIDPQQRLEQGMIDLGRNTTDDLKKLKESLVQQIEEVEHKLSNSQQRIEDCLIEMNCKSATNFETNIEETTDSTQLLEMQINDLYKQMVNNFNSFSTMAKISFISIRQSFKHLIKSHDSLVSKHLKRIEGKIDELITKVNKPSNITHVGGGVSAEYFDENILQLTIRLDNLLEKMKSLETSQEILLKQELKSQESDISLNYDSSPDFESALPN